MEGFKEFQDKSLDAAIIEACDYFNTSREKLEIEIVQDAKSGIFGIVGARKAKIRARRAALRETVESVLGRSTRLNMHLREEGDAPAPEKSDRPEHERTERDRAEPRQEKPSGERAPRAERSKSEKKDDEAALHDGEKREHRSRREERRAAVQCPQRKAAESRDSAPLTTPDVDEHTPRQNAGRQERERRSPSSRRSTQETRPEAEQETSVRPASLDEVMMDEAEEGLSSRSLEELDRARLEGLARQCVTALVRPVVGDLAVPPEVTIVDDRLRVAVDCGDDSGLLIGREGQTLAALQHLASRIVSRGMDAAVRVQLDAGRYRQRQEEKLHDMALTLADKVRQSGRSYSTRPLSSYHRRIVHLCLQEMEDIQTRSTGDGPMKRVVILRRRPDRQNPQEASQEPSFRRAPSESRPRNAAEDATLPAQTAAAEVPSPAGPAPVQAAPAAAAPAPVMGADMPVDRPTETPVMPDMAPYPATPAAAVAEDSPALAPVPAAPCEPPLPCPADTRASEQQTQDSTTDALPGVSAATGARPDTLSGAARN